MINLIGDNLSICFPLILYSSVNSQQLDLVVDIELLQIVRRKRKQKTQARNLAIKDVAHTVNLQEILLFIHRSVFIHNAICESTAVWSQNTRSFHDCAKNSTTYEEGFDTFRKETDWFMRCW